MNSWKRTEYLRKSTAERVEGSRSSMNKSFDLLRRARSRVERGHERRLQIDFFNPVAPTLVDPAPDLAATTPEVTLAPRDLLTVTEVVQGRLFEGERVQLDGKHFIDCTLTNCTLEYAGSTVTLETTQFSGCRFHFTEHAAKTVQFLECFGIIGESAPDYTRNHRGSGLSQRPN